MDQPIQKQDLPRHLKFYATLFETTSMRKWLLNFLGRTGALLELHKMTPEDQVQEFKDAHTRGKPEGSYSYHGVPFTDADWSILLAYLKATVLNLGSLVDHHVSAMQGPATVEWKYTDSPQGTGGTDDE